MEIAALQSKPAILVRGNAISGANIDKANLPPLVKTNPELIH
jgi:hypothetical protein